jgi:nucleoside-diphosphate-sugar epimerase
MERIVPPSSLIGQDDLILVTGAAGFIGSRLVERLISEGFRRLRCLTRRAAGAAYLQTAGQPRDASVEVFRGNLLSREDCTAATKDVAVIFHLAAGRGEKSFPDAYLNSVVTTRNLLQATLQHRSLRRFVNISSLVVYSNVSKPRWRLLDESCPIERRPDLRGEAYCFAKVKQDEIVTDFGLRYGIPYVIVRPGYVYGPGRDGITGRVGMNTFGIFAHLGGSNAIPFTFVDNCVDAILRAGITKGVDGQVFNVVDDELPSSRRFLRHYKRRVGPFTSLYIPHFVSYVFCYLWERYSQWSAGQLQPVFNRRGWHAYWKKTRYSNAKTKAMLGWAPRISTATGLERYFRSCRERRQHA